ncbi:MAG: hypothetical protein AAFV90_05965 [Cyanobacteria bacterium J06634_5]
MTTAYAAGSGAPIYAPAGGRIEVVGRVKDGFVLNATGFASGPNLHWRLFVNGVSIDPEPWRYDGVE